MAPKDPTPTTESLPFGAMERTQKPAKRRPTRKRKATKSSAQETPAKADAQRDGQGQGGEQQGQRRKKSRRGGRRRRKQKDREEGKSGGEAHSSGSAPDKSTTGEAQAGEAATGTSRRRRGRRRNKHEGGRSPERSSDGGQQTARESTLGQGLFIAEKGGYGTLRQEAKQYISTKQDIYVPQRLIQKHRLRDGSIIEGPVSRGKKHKFQLEAVNTVDGEDPAQLATLRPFKSLTSIDPDFHYAVGDVTGDVSMRILDIISPVGRGQRGLIVAQPRTGKTTLMRQFARGIEEGYPEVHLFVLLVDERPEEATEWIRSTKGKVFVSTSDESPANHVKLAEAVWKRCQRLVELGEDVVLIMDSITRLARAYNNHSGGSGRTMSGGLDSRAMERPRQIFGSARNTETAGSLTILSTALIDTGSKMDQLIFEEFKGTGNMEVMLNRKLSDRRIFPSIDIEKSGTRKEEKLITSNKLRLINTLRRVLLRMNFIEAMELLVAKLEDVEKTEDFLARFEVDPEA
ncbi:MAG: transcription termination factor Rho [bacterium]